MGVNYLITSRRCSVLSHELQTFRVTNATILSAQLRQQWSLGTFYSCLVDVQFTPDTTGTPAGSESTSTGDNGPDDDNDTNGSNPPPGDHVNDPIPGHTQSLPPRRVGHHQQSLTGGSSSGGSVKVWVELACPSASFCQRHCQVSDTPEQLWYDPTAPTRRLNWESPDAASCYGFIMGLYIAIGICTLGVVVDWMVERKCPARHEDHDIASLLAASSSRYPGRGYPSGYGATHSSYGYGSMT